MNFIFLFFLQSVFAISLLHAERYPYPTLIPKESQVSDFEVRFALAKIYSHQNATREKALFLYEQLLHIDPKPVPISTKTDTVLKLQVDEEDSLTKESDTSHTIVPKESQIHVGEVKLALARIYSHSEDTSEKAFSLYEWLLKKDPKKVDLYLEYREDHRFNLLNI